LTEQVVLPLRVRPQPVPHLNPGGDCGACVLAGLLGLEPAQVYERLCAGKVESIGYPEMQRLLRAHPELFDRAVWEAPLGWPVYDIQRAFGAPAHLQGSAWFAYVRMAIDAGYYGIANVDFRRGGTTGYGPDHWVLICGARLRPPPPGESGRVWQEVLVSCSAKSSPDEEWVDAHDFLRERGGFNLLLARPRGGGAP
jgi:hypothetical protein